MCHAFTVFTELKTQWPKLGIACELILFDELYQIIEREAVDNFITAAEVDLIVFGTATERPASPCSSC